MQQIHFIKQQWIRLCQNLKLEKIDKWVKFLIIIFLIRNFAIFLKKFCELNCKNVTNLSNGGILFLIVIQNLKDIIIL